MPDVKVQNIGTYSFERTGDSTRAHKMGMREMQERVYARRASRLLLIKAPPASGKSRALMYLALDKVHNQGIDKVIIAVPQMAIGSSFKDTDLKSGGFFADWHIDQGYDLCLPGAEEGKAQTVLNFINDPDAHYLLCAHPTLVYFYDRLQDKSLLDRALVAVDEFHHVSANEENRLGSVIHSLINDTKAHIAAMTGSYFRGDSVPVLSNDDERLFDTVTYTYYEQLNGYTYLKSLGINYAFYRGRWTDALHGVLDPSRKTIIHIPKTNANESTGDKYNEVGKIISAIGKGGVLDSKTGFYLVTAGDGRTLRVADLVTEERQYTTLSALRQVRRRDDVDIIIAMNMAKEGFDWPWCEHALTVAYRSSLTEVVQIIGRATRDCEGKEHAQFTNLIAAPAGTKEEVGEGVNSLLKAITLSLLMEQVLTPNVHFRSHSQKEDGDNGGMTVVIDDEKMARLGEEGRKVLKIMEENPDKILEKLLNTSKNIPVDVLSDEYGKISELVKADIEKLIRDIESELSEEQIDILIEAFVALMVRKRLEALKGKAGLPKAGDGEGPGAGDGQGAGAQAQPGITPDEVAPNPAFLEMAKKFINVDNVDLDMIAKINPFFGYYDFISRAIDPKTLRDIRDGLIATRSKMSEQEAVLLWRHINRFCKEHGREPDPNSTRDDERRFAEALAFIRHKKALKLREAAGNAGTQGEAQA